MRSAKLYLLGAFPVVFLIWWIYKSFPENVFPLAGGGACRVQFHQWYSGRCVVSCFRNDHYYGKAVLGEGLFTHPFAVVPGPDGKTLVCFSILDTTDAVFTLDLDRLEPTGVSIPVRLNDAVDFSQFPVRACTRSEVGFIAEFIRKAEIKDLSNYVYGGINAEGRRADFLKFLQWGTSNPDWRDPNQKRVRPQILPEGD